MSKNYLNKLFFDNRYRISEFLCTVFDTSIEKTHSALLKSFFNDDLKIDVESSKNKVKEIFNFSSFYVVDYNEPLEGGYSRKEVRRILTENGNTNSHILGWDRYVNDLKTICISRSRLDIDTLSDTFKIFDRRTPKSTREKAVSNLNKESKFFNLKESTLFCKKLIDINFHEFKENKKKYKKGFLKYEKSIDNKYLLVLDVNLSAFKNELRNFYFTLPKINVEVWSKTQKGFVNPEDYLVGSENSLVYRIGWNFFLGINGYFRVGSIYDDSMFLMENSFFYFEQQCFFLKKYIYLVEDIITHSDFAI